MLREAHRGARPAGDGSIPALKWQDVFKGRVNTPHEDIYRNIRSNLRRQLPQVMWYPANDYKVALLCGGPSLKRAKLPRGYKFTTVNGTHDWLKDQGRKPAVHIQMDARPFNARFVERPVLGCRYLVNIQSDPAVLDALEGHDVHLWTGVSRTSSIPECRILNKFYLGRWLNVIGGSTVGTRAIGLLYLLGVRTVRIYGMDGCLARGAHHAFAQPENDGEPVHHVVVGRRKFATHNWMLAQLDDFMKMAPHIPDDLRFGIEGDGLIAHVVNYTRKHGRVPEIKMVD